MSPRSHSFFQDLLETHISGASLDPEDRLELFDHIETCDQCRKILEAEERLTARMKTIPRMVAPSDLRSRILNQAIRDHTERTTTPSEDPHVADLLVTPPQTHVEKVVPAAPAIGHPPSHNAGDGLPFFPAVTAPRPARLRSFWRKASPAFATGFLAIASIGALYTGQFQGIPLASEAQQLVWAAVDSAMGKDPTAIGPGIAVASTGKQSEPAFVSNMELAADIAETGPAADTLTASPLPGTSQAAAVVRNARSWLSSVDSTVAALARATEEKIPAPAEKSAPQIAALVLKATDSSGGSGGFRQSELAEALEVVTKHHLGGRLTGHDQFAMDGQRYRLYTLELPAGCTSRLVKNLTPYQASADGQIVKAIETQTQRAATPDGAIRFFTGNQSGLRDAIETVSPVVSTGRPERVQVIVVE